MGRIRVQEFVSLDGVYENPAWTAPYGFTDAMMTRTAEWTGSSSALLLGRVTWEMFAPAWSARSPEDDPGAAFFNESPKYVVSTSLTATDAWPNSSVLGRYDADRIRAVKDDLAGDLYISGSGTLVRALLADGLVDELNLLVYPVVLGAGTRLFPEGTPQLALTATGQQSFDNGVVLMTYGPRADG